MLEHTFLQSILGVGIIIAIIIGIIVAIIIIIIKILKKLPIGDAKRRGHLKDRLVNGEITKEEYDKLKKQLDES
ncbi:SHOCT domain-containing protein [Nitrosopumilus sp.]|uniref:SHOCT domain-containing protein n=1 Tax=Nitrosopumilus sp. TaxID=2024843 RepID=UPI0034A02700